MSIPTDTSDSCPMVDEFVYLSSPSSSPVTEYEPVPEEKPEIKFELADVSFVEQEPEPGSEWVAISFTSLEKDSVRATIEKLLNLDANLGATTKDLWEKIVIQGIPADL